MFQTFVRMIQDSEAIDTVAETVQPPLREAFRGTSGGKRALKDFLSGTWIGHALHPILTDIPIGAWTMAELFDISGQESAADISVATGIVGALASAVTGLSDWSDTHGRARRIGVAHATLNVTAVTLYTASLFTRRTNRTAGVQLGFCGYAVMLLGAYLGGHLVFGQQIGVNHAALPRLPMEFAPVLPLAELEENRPKRVTHKGLRVVLVRHGEKIHALYERCSHLGGPLSEGTIEDGSIRCPWHASRFSLDDGSVLEGPATTPQPCFETRVIDGMIQIRALEPESP